MYRNLLPIGSVVILKGGDKKIMICSRIQAREGEDTIYDYSACYYPEGIVGPSNMIFFNRDSIELIYFIGFQDKDELDFRHNFLDKLGKLEVKDNVIVEQKQD